MAAAVPSPQTLAAQNCRDTAAMSLPRMAEASRSVQSRILDRGPSLRGHSLKRAVSKGGRLQIPGRKVELRAASIGLTLLSETKPDLLRAPELKARQHRVLSAGLISSPSSRTWLRSLGPRGCRPKAARSTRIAASADEHSKTAAGPAHTSRGTERSSSVDSQQQPSGGGSRPFLRPPSLWSWLAGSRGFWWLATRMGIFVGLLLATLLQGSGPFATHSALAAQGAVATAPTAAAAVAGAAAAPAAATSTSMAAGAAATSIQGLRNWLVASSPTMSALWKVLRQHGLLLTVLLALSAFFSMAETSITTLWPWKVRELAEKETEGSVFQLLRRDVTRFLTTILIGTTLVNIWATALVTEAATELFGQAGVNLATGVMTVLLLLFTEIAPKSIAVHNAAQVVRMVVRPVAWLSVVLYPVGRVCTYISTALLRLLGLNSSGEPFVSEEELKLMLRGAEMSGAIEEEEQDMIENVLDIKDTYVREVMTPLVDVVAIDAAAPLMEFRNLWAKQQYSRIPVYKGRVDNIVGIAYAMDMLDYIEQPEFLMRLKVGRMAHSPAYFVPDSMSVWNLLREFRIRKVHMAIVLNEYGGTVGLVTLEDAVEEIVGEIFDENDSKEEIRKKTGYIIQRAEGVFDVDANTNIEDLAEAFQVSIPPESTYYETVSGFVCEAFGYIPRTGDKKVIRLRRSLSDEEANGSSVRPSGPSSPIRGGKQRGGDEDEFARNEEDEGGAGRDKEDDKSCPRDKDYKTFRIEILTGNARKVGAVRFEMVDVCDAAEPPGSSAEAREKERALEEEAERERERERERALQEAWRLEQTREGRRREKLRRLEEEGTWHEDDEDDEGGGEPGDSSEDERGERFREQGLGRGAAQGSARGDESGEENSDAPWMLQQPFSGMDSEQDEEGEDVGARQGNGRSTSYNGSRAGVGSGSALMPSAVIEPSFGGADDTPSSAEPAAGVMSSAQPYTTLETTSQGSALERGRGGAPGALRAESVEAEFSSDAPLVPARTVRYTQGVPAQESRGSLERFESEGGELSRREGGLAGLGRVGGDSMSLSELVETASLPGGPKGRVVYEESRSMRVEMDLGGGADPGLGLQQMSGGGSFSDPWEEKERQIERRQQRRRKERQEATAELERRERSMRRDGGDRGNM